MTIPLAPTDEEQEWKRMEFEEGGPVWKRAGELAAEKYRVLLKERLQSRADPSIQLRPSTTTAPSLPVSPQRVNIIWIVGVLAVLCGWLGNFFISNSCYFASIPVDVAGSTFSLHFGLWKYSPVDSALTGYSTCYPFSNAYPEPILARIWNGLALLSGTLSLSLLWWYLISGKVVGWKVAIVSAWVASAAQLAVVIAFAFSQLCRNNPCRVGPALSLSCIVAVGWGLLGLELRTHEPNSQ